MTGPRGSCRQHRLLLALVVAMLAAVTLLAGCGDDPAVPSVLNDPTATEADHEYVIPRGTGLRLDRGEPVELIPGELEVQVGEVIRIVNEDDRGHLVGPFFVGANETLTQRFASPGRFVGECTVHPSGQLVLEVRE